MRRIGAACVAMPPHPEILEDPPRAVAERAGAVVEARLARRLRRTALHQRHAQAQRFERDRGLAPTRPPPTIATSTSPLMPPPSALRSRLVLWARRRSARCARRGSPARRPRCGMPMPRSAAARPGARRDVEARLDRQHHPRLQHPPLLAELVVADVVHVHAQPVAGAVHVELAVGTDLTTSAGTRPSAGRASPARRRQHLHRGPSCGLFQWLPGFTFGGGGVVGLEHHVVDRALPGVKRPLIGKVRVMSEAYFSYSQPASISSSSPSFSSQSFSR